MTPFLVPIIRYSVDIKEKAYIYLQEDGLELLLSYIESCTTYNDDMLSLIDYLLPLLGKYFCKFLMFYVFFYKYLIFIFFLHNRLFY